MSFDIEVSVSVFHRDLSVLDPVLNISINKLNTSLNIKVKNAASDIQHVLG